MSKSGADANNTTKLSEWCQSYPDHKDFVQELRETSLVPKGEPETRTGSPFSRELRKEAIPPTPTYFLKGPPTGIKHWYTFIDEKDGIILGHGQCICGKAVADGIRPFKDIWEEHMREVYAKPDAVPPTPTTCDNPHCFGEYCGLERPIEYPPMDDAALEYVKADPYTDQQLVAEIERLRAETRILVEQKEAMREAIKEYKREISAPKGSVKPDAVPQTCCDKGSACEGHNAQSVPVAAKRRELAKPDAVPWEIKTLTDLCEANVVSFSNDQMSAALAFAASRESESQQEIERLKKCNWSLTNQLSARSHAWHTQTHSSPGEGTKWKYEDCQRDECVRDRKAMEGLK